MHEILNFTGQLSVSIVAHIFLSANLFGMMVRIRLWGREMITLKIITDLDGIWKDLRDRQPDIIHVKNNISIGRLSHGMQSGKSSVAIRIDLPDGKVVIAETSMVNFLACARIFNAKEKVSE